MKRLWAVFVASVYVIVFQTAIQMQNGVGVFFLNWLTIFPAEMLWLYSLPNDIFLIAGFLSMVGSYGMMRRGLVSKTVLFIEILFVCSSMAFIYEAGLSQQGFYTRYWWNKQVVNIELLLPAYLRITNAALCYTTGILSPLLLLIRRVASRAPR